METKGENGSEIEAIGRNKPPRSPKTISRPRHASNIEPFSNRLRWSRLLRGLLALSLNHRLGSFRRLLFFGRLGVTASSQAFVQKLVACFVIEACCLFASAVAWPRARPVAALAPLNHMLMKGFFFVHGLITGEASYSDRPCFPAMLASSGKYTSHRSWMLAS